MNTLTIDTAPAYPVLVGRDFLKDVGAHTAPLHAPCHVHIVTDSNVGPLYADPVRESYLAAGYRVHVTTLPAGEESKSTDVLVSLLETWASQELHRSDLAVALGGGVIGDLTGFAAAVYQRGMDFIQIPTTFLAAIDSSVGGKTAVNLQSGKNLVGAFHQPKAVFCDITTLGTLTHAAFLEGIAEALKYGILTDEALFDRLANNPVQATDPQLDAIITDCIQHKAYFVHEDTYDRGLRQKLNLGHTAAHAIEYLSDFKTTHGQAVAAGLALMTRAAERSGLAEPGTAAKVEQALTLYGLPITTDSAVDDLVAACRRDKKAFADGVTVVLPEKIGATRLQSVRFDELADLFRLGKEPL